MLHFFHKKYQICIMKHENKVNNITALTAKENTIYFKFESLFMASEAHILTCWLPCRVPICLLLHFKSVTSLWFCNDSFWKCHWYSFWLLVLCLSNAAFLSFRRHLLSSLFEVLKILSVGWQINYCYHSLDSLFPQTGIDKKIWVGG